MRLRAVTPLFVAAGLLAAGCARARPDAPRPDGAGGRAGTATVPAPAAAEANIPETKAERGTFLSLLYGANLQGAYENCGCPSHPLGGLPPPAPVVARARGDAEAVQ